MIVSIENGQQIDIMSLQLTNFLRKENKILKQENKELKELLELNRQALKVSNKTGSGESHYDVLFKLLYEENSKLHRKIKELNIQLETGMCKALISEQIAFASTEHQKYLTEELKDRLKKMRKQLQHRDKKLYQLQKQVFEGENAECRVIQVTDMNTVTKKYKDYVGDLKNEIEDKRQQVMKYKDQKQQLLKLNLILTKQINELKYITSQQSTDSKDLRGSNSGDLSKFMNYQKKIVQDQDEDEESDDYNQFQQSSSEPQSDYEPLPVNQVSKISKLQISKVPKLQLKKAKEIQDLIVQKINNEQNKKKGAMKEQKYRKMQVQLNQTRKKIGQIAIQKLDLEKQNQFLKKFVKQIESRNEILVSQRRMMTQENQPMYRQQQSDNQIQTLLDICRDVTMNQLLRDVVKGIVTLPKRNGIISYDI